MVGRFEYTLWDVRHTKITAIDSSMKMSTWLMKWTYVSKVKLSPFLLGHTVYLLNIIQQKQRQLLGVPIPILYADV